MPLYHFTVPISWTLTSKGCRSDGDLKLFRGGLGGTAGAAVYAYDLGHLRTPLPQVHPQLKRLTRLQGADADACEGGRMQESVAGPVRELDEPVPFVGVEPFDLSPNRPGRMIPLILVRQEARVVGIAQWLVVAILFTDDVLMSLTKISAFFEMNFPIACHATMRALAGLAEVPTLSTTDARVNARRHAPDGF
jgi:hypothetical protein